MITKNILTIVGSVVVFLAAVFGVLNGILDMRDRLRSSSAAKTPAEDEAKTPAQAPVPITSNTFLGRLRFISPYIWDIELALLVGLGVILNYGGLAISTQLSSVFFLDMTGTALGAFLLGPWWGATIGLLSNSLNWFLFPKGQAEIYVFPWLMVNMAGGLFWGFMARTKGFRTYISSTQESSAPHLIFLLKFGVLGAAVMAMVGTGVMAAVPQQGLSLNAAVAEHVERFLTDFRNILTPLFVGAFGSKVGQALAWGIPNSLQQWLLYIPDKTISVAMALAIIKFGLPLFQRELISGGASHKPPRDNWVSPVVVGLVFAPLFTALMVFKVYQHGRFWPFWSLPLLLVCIGILYELTRGPSFSVVVADRARRAEVYARAMEVSAANETDPFRAGLKLATLIASIVLVLWLPMLRLETSNLYRAVVYFFCVVYGFIFGIKVIFAMVRQNIATLQIASDQSEHDGGIGAAGGAEKSVIQFQKPHA